METQDVQRRAQVITEVLGESTLHGWRRRLKEGVIVDLEIKRWRGRKKLDLIDLGIEPTDLETRRAFRELLNLGSKLLMPQEVVGRLDSIERYARQVLGRYSYDTPWGHFLPYSTYSTWRDENERWRDEYFAVRDEIYETYPEQVATLLQQYAPIGRHAYQLMLSQVPEILAQRGLSSEDAFLAFFLEKIRAAIPSGEQVKDSFVYNYDLRQIEPDLLNPQSQRVNDQQITEAAEEAERIRQEEVERERQAREEAEVRARSLRRYEEEMDRMNRDLVQKARERREQSVEKFFGALMTQLRSLTYDVAVDVLESIKKNGETLRGRSKMQLKNLVDQVRELNFYGDPDIDGIMNRLQDIVDQPARDRDVSEIERQIRAVALVTRRTLLELGQEVRSERDREVDIDIPDVPGEEDIREARLELSLPLPARLAAPDESEREERELTEPQNIHVGETDIVRFERG
ncbi:MAG TPA: DUF3150 domain-containing protein [Ktedonobacteraceae bacterium]|nr:DUF3150 domain-containing protein [Ktedonobacteraceae bacterium]